MDRKPSFNGRQLLAHLQSSHRPCILIDQHGEVVFANEAAAEVLHTSSETLIGYSLFARTDENASRSSEELPLLISELQACFEASDLIRKNNCDLIRRPQSESEYVAWTVTVFPDDREKNLLLLTAVTHSDSLFQHFKPSSNWKLDQETRDYLFGLQSQQYSLRRMLQIMGPTSASKLALQQTQLAIDSQVPVLISGEVGTGKRKLAEAILFHRGRSAKKKPPTIISCKLLDQTLIRELVELVREDCQSSKQNQQIGPALLIDRLDLLPLDCVSLMEQLIQTAAGCSMVVTSESPNSNLPSALVAIGDMVAVLSIHLVSMRDRIADQNYLIKQILTQACGEGEAAKLPSISDAARTMLSTYSWPGNLAEFDAAITAAGKIQTGGEILPEHLPLSIRCFPSSELEQNDEPIDLEKVLETIEKQIITNAIAAFPRSRAMTAKMLGLSRAKLLRRIDALGIETPKEAEDKSDAAPAPADELRVNTRKKKPLTDEELIEMTTEETDETPVFKEIDDE